MQPATNWDQPWRAYATTRHHYQSAEPPNGGVRTTDQRNVGRRQPAKAGLYNNSPSNNPSAISIRKPRPLCLLSAAVIPKSKGKARAKYSAVMQVKTPQSSPLACRGPDTQGRCHGPALDPEVVQTVVPRIAGQEPPQGGEAMLTVPRAGIIVTKFPALHVDHCECPMVVANVDRDENLACSKQRAAHLLPGPDSQDVLIVHPPRLRRPSRLHPPPRYPRPPRTS